MKGSKQLLAGLVVCLFFAAGCGSNMEDQAKVEPFEASEFFAHNQSARPLPPHTIPIDRRVEREGFYTGRTADGALLETIPLTVTAEVVEQGQTQFQIFCTPCHGQSGAGDGLIIERGFPAPPSFHIERLRQAPAGHYFEVITHGQAEMLSYAHQVTPANRWAIIAYIRQLQSSLNGASAPTGEASQEQNDE